MKINRRNAICGALAAALLASTAAVAQLATPRTLEELKAIVDPRVSESGNFLTLGANFNF